jgi:hypothetical protein
VNIFLAVLQAMPALLDMIVTAEQLFKGAGSGAVKKETVMNGVGAALDVATAAGAKVPAELRPALTSGLSALVDTTVKTFNASGWPKLVADTSAK